MTDLHRHPGRGAIPALAGLLLAGGLLASPAGAASPVASPGPTHYPVTIEDCGGRTTTYDQAPQRVVTVDPNVTEMLLVLGLKDRIVGYTDFYSPAQQWGPTKADMATLDRINDGANYPSQEAIAAVSPDLVTSIYPWAFGYGLPDRDGWTALGVHSYQTLGECDWGNGTHDLSLLYRDLRAFGMLFDVQAKAEEVIAGLEGRVAAAQQRIKDAGVPSHLIATHDGETEHPAAYGNTASALIALAGSRYLFDGLTADQIPSWEAFVAGDPDVIWVVPDAGRTVEAIEQQLTSDPRTAGVSGVKDAAWVIVPQADGTVESPRMVDGLESLVDQLIALK
ncbi:MAG: ABC transporter substrate-binding protein [Chloroflexota bacterium]